MPWCSLLLLFLPISAVHNGNDQPKSYIDWTIARKLTWNDFQAPADNRSGNAALTNAGITIDFSYHGSELVYSVFCRFDKTKSWVKIKTDYILGHEQGHFDIAEIYARKLFKALRAYHPDEKNLSRDINKIYREMMLAFHEEEADYDRETNFSIEQQQQAAWKKRISDELESLKDFAEYQSK